jgi:hypothetical protein
VTSWSCFCTSGLLRHVLAIPEIQVCVVANVSRDLLARHEASIPYESSTPVGFPLSIDFC